MAIEVIPQNDGHRINHPVYNDVYNVTYAKGVITEFEIEENPSTFDLWGDGNPDFYIDCTNWEYTDLVKIDLCEDWLPLFYHCKLHCYDDEVATLRDNGALKGSALAFQIGDEVKVLLEEGESKYIIGHVDNKPRMCVDLIKFSLSNVDTFYLIGIGQVDNKEFIPPDYYGNIPNTEAGIKLFDISLCEICDYGEYFCEYLIKCGGILYFIRLKNLRQKLDLGHFGTYAVYPNKCMIYSAPWSQELDDQCHNIGTVVSDPEHHSIVWGDLPNEMQLQGKFSEALFKKFDEIQQWPFVPNWKSIIIEGQSYYEE